MASQAVHFLLNNQRITLEGVDPNLSVLNYLREHQFKSGTKEGCASGDCGACTVVVAELSAEKPKELIYKSVNACITFVGSLHGKQLITVEDLKQKSKLHHVQQSIVDNHGSQCGFCTPGFVMSSFALHKNIEKPNRAEVLEALAGNLCRCTGYRAIVDAAIATTPKKDDSFTQHYQQTITQLTELNQLADAKLSGQGRSYSAPSSIKQFAEQLIEKPHSVMVGGGTDLALSVTQQLKNIDALIYTGNVTELNHISETDEHIIIGSAVPYSKFTPLLANEYHELGEMIERIGSLQIRNTGTLGGNIGNASPIGDMPPALIALGASMTLQKGDSTRTVPVEDYFIDYKKTILAPAEFIKNVTIPKAKPNQFLKVYKISKRFDDDISAVLAAFHFELQGQTIKSVRMAFGGMAAIPARAKNAEAALRNKNITPKTINAAKVALTQDFSPMSDVRASASYRMKIAQNLIEKCFIEIQNRDIETRVVNYA